MAEQARVFKMDRELATETSLVDIAYLILNDTNQSYHYREIMDMITRVRDVHPDEYIHSLARLFTEMNIDGRFITTGNGVWGLKRWYAMDKSNDKVSSGNRRFISKDEDDEFYDDDEDELLVPDEEDDFGDGFITESEDGEVVDEEVDEDAEDVEEEADELLVDGEDEDADSEEDES